MIASFGIRYANRKTLGMLTIAPDEHPVGVQVFGADVGRHGRGRPGGRGGRRRPDRHQHGLPGPQDLQDGRRRGAARRPATRPRGSSTAMVRAVDVPVTVKMRRGLTPRTSTPGRDRPPLRGGRRRGALPAPARRGRGVRGHAPTTASRPRSSRRSACRSSPAATSPRPREARRVLEDTGCAAVAVGRAAPRQPVGLRRDPAPGRRAPRPGLAEVVDELAAVRRRRARSPSASRAPCGYMRKFYPLVPRRTRRAGRRAARRSSPPRPWTAPSRACGRSPRPPAAA